jgi:prepilin-type N-terminal cleavage/methylation domain-containing protein
MHKIKHGFSLIKLLVVVAILGILAATGTVGYQNYIDGKRISSTDTEREQKAQKLENDIRKLENDIRKLENDIRKLENDIIAAQTGLIGGDSDGTRISSTDIEREQKVRKLENDIIAAQTGVIGGDSDGTRISSTDIEREQKVQKLENTPSQLSFAESKFAGAYVSLLLNRIKGDTDEGKGDVTASSSNHILNFNDGASLKGYGGTLKVGKNIIFNKNLAGLEFGASFQDINDQSIKNVSYTDVAADATFTDLYPIAVKTNVKNYQTLAIRLGHIFEDQTLFYLSGGAAVGLVKRTMYQPSDAGNFNWWDLGNSVSKSNWETGYTLGLGIEHKIKDNLSLRVNYEYVDFGNVRHSYQSTEGVNTVIINQAADIKLSSLGVGLTYSF